MSDITLSPLPCLYACVLSHNINEWVNEVVSLSVLSHSWNSRYTAQVLPMLITMERLGNQVTARDRYISSPHTHGDISKAQAIMNSECDQAQALAVEIRRILDPILYTL